MIKRCILATAAALIMVAGTSASAQDCLTGEVRTFAGNFPPRGWAFTHGQVLSIAEHQALFSIIGTLYGGDGRQTFALPDSRGRVIVGAGAGEGLTQRDVGSRFGSEAVWQDAVPVAQPNGDEPTQLVKKNEPRGDSIVPPSIAMFQMICIEGFYPSRD